MLKKGTLVVCSVHTSKEVRNGLTEHYDGELFLGIIEDPGTNSGLIVVNLGRLGEYRTTEKSGGLLPIAETDGSPEVLKAIEIIEEHTERIQKVLTGIMTPLLRKPA
ncbi:MAG: hypothetical protein V1868_02215 [Patescibacteria group bacterium]